MDEKIINLPQPEIRCCIYGQKLSPRERLTQLLEAMEKGEPVSGLIYRLNEYYSEAGLSLGSGIEGVIYKGDIVPGKDKYARILQKRKVLVLLKDYRDGVFVCDRATLVRQAEKELLRLSRLVLRTECYVYSVTEEFALVDAGGGVVVRVPVNQFMSDVKVGTFRQVCFVPGWQKRELRLTFSMSPELGNVYPVRFVIKKEGKWVGEIEGHPELRGEIHGLYPHSLYEVGDIYPALVRDEISPGKYLFSLI